MCFIDILFLKKILGFIANKHGKKTKFCFNPHNTNFAIEIVHCFRLIIIIINLPVICRIKLQKILAKIIHSLKIA